MNIEIREDEDVNNPKEWKFDNDAEANKTADNKQSNLFSIMHNGQQLEVKEYMYKAYAEMNSYKEIDNRVIPRKIGSTFVVCYNSKSKPTMTIGPHFPMTIWLIILK